MGSVHEGKKRKKCREESSEMVEPTVKAQEHESGWNAKSPCGVYVEKTMVAMTAETSNEELVQVEDQEEGEIIKNGDGDFVGVATENGPVSVVSWDDEYWPCSWSCFEEERMMLGWIWYPYSDEELLSFGVYAEDEEVLWADDLWNLKDIKDIPNP